MRRCSISVSLSVILSTSLLGTMKVHARLETALTTDGIRLQNPQVMGQAMGCTRHQTYGSAPTGAQPMMVCAKCPPVAGRHDQLAQHALIEARGSGAVGAPQIHVKQTCDTTVALPKATKHGYKQIPHQPKPKTAVEAKPARLCRNKKDGCGGKAIVRKVQRRPPTKKEQWQRLSARQRAIARAEEQHDRSGDESLLSQGIEGNPGPALDEPAPAPTEEELRAQGWAIARNAVDVYEFLREVLAVAQVPMAWSAYSTRMPGWYHLRAHFYRGTRRIYSEVLLCSADDYRMASAAFRRLLAGGIEPNPGPPKRNGEGPPPLILVQEAGVCVHDRACIVRGMHYHVLLRRGQKEEEPAPRRGAAKGGAAAVAPADGGGKEAARRVALKAARKYGFVGPCDSADVLPTCPPKHWHEARLVAPALAWRLVRGAPESVEEERGVEALFRAGVRKPAADAVRAVDPDRVAGEEDAREEKEAESGGEEEEEKEDEESEGDAEGEDVRDGRQPVHDRVPDGLRAQGVPPVRNAIPAQAARAAPQRAVAAALVPAPAPVAAHHAAPVIYVPAAPPAHAAPIIAAVAPVAAALVVAPAAAGIAPPGAAAIAAAPGAGALLAPAAAAPIAAAAAPVVAPAAAPIVGAPLAPALVAPVAVAVVPAVAPVPHWATALAVVWLGYLITTPLAHAVVARRAFIRSIALWMLRSYLLLLVVQYAVGRFPGLPRKYILQRKIFSMAISLLVKFLITGLQRWQQHGLLRAMETLPYPAGFVLPGRFLFVQRTIYTGAQPISIARIFGSLCGMPYMPGTVRKHNLTGPTSHRYEVGQGEQDWVTPDTLGVVIAFMAVAVYYYGSGLLVHCLCTYTRIIILQKWLALGQTIPVMAGFAYQIRKYIKAHKCGHDVLSYCGYGSFINTWVADTYVAKFLGSPECNQVKYVRSHLGSPQSTLSDRVRNILATNPDGTADAIWTELNTSGGGQGHLIAEDTVTYCCNVVAMRDVRQIMRHPPQTRLPTFPFALTST